MFFKSEIIVDQLPGKKLAEDYFMYCEDVLWCWQIKKLGYSIWFTPEPKSDCTFIMVPLIRKNKSE